MCALSVDDLGRDQTRSFSLQTEPGHPARQRERRSYGAFVMSAPHPEKVGLHHERDTARDQLRGAVLVKILTVMRETARRSRPTLTSTTSK